MTRNFSKRDAVFFKSVAKALWILWLNREVYMHVKDTFKGY